MRQIQHHSMLTFSAAVAACMLCCTVLGIMQESMIPRHLTGTDREVARTLAAAQALESSVRAGSAFHQPPTVAADQQQKPGSALSADAAVAANAAQRFKLRKAQSELCPQLVQQLQASMAVAGQDSQKFIEATQKVGSVMYMAPEVLTGGWVGWWG